MDIGTQILIIVLWTIFCGIFTKLNSDRKVNKTLWLIDLGIFSIFAILDMLNAISIFP